MGTVNGALLINLLHLETGFDDETMEHIIDEAINLLNLYGEIELPILSGTAGSKSVSLTSAQQGAVVMVTKALFKEYYEDDEGSVNVGGIALASASLLSNPQVMRTVRAAARLLYKRENEMEVDVG